jgi:hypothetical protein
MGLINKKKITFLKLNQGKKTPAGVWAKLFAATVFFLFSFISTSAFAQGDATVGARLDARQITIGDQARLFIEARTNPSSCRLQWAAIPDTFNSLEVTKGKIDTIKEGGFITYRQRLLITGFDSGIFKIPAFVFPVIPNTGTAYTIQSDSFQLLVQTVAVDTTKAFKGIKGIINVKSSWHDYIGYIVAGWLALLIIAGVIIYLTRRKKPGLLLPRKPEKTLQEITLGKLAALEAQQLWQKNKVKEYYIELTDIVRSYVEQRFQTPAMELTTDELLDKAHQHSELVPYYEPLSVILHTADLAKFAKAQPLPAEHVSAMDHAKEFVATSKPKPVTEPPIEKTI